MAEIDHPSRQRDRAFRSFGTPSHKVDDGRRDFALVSIRDGARRKAEAANAHLRIEFIDAMVNRAIVD
jgi:hypothetical protein